jgi:hypothetical protein
MKCTHLVPELPLSSDQISKTRRCGRHSRQASTLSQLLRSRGFLAQDHPTGERRNLGPSHSRQVIEIRSTSSNRARIQRTSIQLEQQTLIVDHLAVLRSCFRARPLIQESVLPPPTRSRSLCSISNERNTRTRRWRSNDLCLACIGGMYLYRMRLPDYNHVVQSG